MGAAAIVPAAGKAERFGGGKLTVPIHGEPLLSHTLRSLLDGGVTRIIVVTAPGAALNDVALLRDPRVERAENPDPARGMFSSIQTGAAALTTSSAALTRDVAAVLVLPGDMPFVQSATVARVIARAAEPDSRDGLIVSPRFQGRHGHPVALPVALMHDILSASPVMTLAHLIDARGAARVFVDVDDPGVVRDVDVRADLGGGQAP